jgi:hypothetical protein
VDTDEENEMTVPLKFYAEVRGYSDGQLEAIVDEHQDVVEMYPDTEMAKDAQKILDIVDTEFGYRITVEDLAVAAAERRAGA